MMKEEPPQPPLADLANSLFDLLDALLQLSYSLQQRWLDAQGRGHDGISEQSRQLLERVKSQPPSPKLPDTPQP